VTVPTAARQLGADLLHVPYWAAPLITPLPTVVTIHDIIPRVLPAYRGSLKVRLYTALVSATALRAQRILTDSEAARRDILRHLRVPENRVRAVPLAADAAYTPEPGDEEASLRDQMGLPGAYILYLGGFDVRKNVQTLCRAFKIVHQTRSDAQLVIGGRLPQTDTSFTPDPRRLAREAGLDEDSVHFLGFVPETATPALYRGARLFVWPTTYEGFGLPPLEALSCGTPVVCSNTTSLPEIVGNAGLLLNAEDVEGIAGAMLQLWIDDAFHQDLQARARRQARTFSWERTAQETLRTYQDTVAQR
jgi:glycosyltransferase involved in cell wall biosynthesis